MADNINRRKADKSTYTMSRGGIRIGGGGDNAFNTIELDRPDSSHFELTHSHTTTLNMGELAPIMIMECYPGDRVKISNELLIRVMPLISPAMQRIDGYIHSFFIPHRIIWEDFEKFLKGDAVTLPYLDIQAAQVTPGSLVDYVGVPVLTDPNTVRINPICLAAYQRVFFEYYRDQNLSLMTDGDKPYAITGDNLAQSAMLRTLRKRAYNHDYFTSALPFTQKGTEATISFDFEDVMVKVQQDNPPTGDTSWIVSGQLEPVTSAAVPGIFPVGESEGLTLFVNQPYAETSELTGTGFSINDFRLALATQHWLERMAVGGTRMTEIIKAHFGVNSSDQRLDRPEYIGGMRTPIIISEVLQTGESGTTPQGNMAGHGLAASFQEPDDQYYCEEHGYIISIASVMPQAIYATGLPRFLDWSVRNERNEWYWPQFANLGEQAIKVREIYADCPPSVQEQDWGYTARFNELRYMPNRISGSIRQNLSHYTAARLFPGPDTPPALNEAFLTDVGADVAKLFAFPEGGQLVVNILSKIDAIRLLPKYATPKLVG